jgi:inosine/xanthosine triphosphatase
MMEKTITIGSKNYAKVEAVKTIFHDYQVIGKSVPSNVSEQPLSDEETIVGAINRAKNALEAGDSHLGIGLEGGVMELTSGMYVCNWGALVDRTGAIYTAGGARIKLPDEIALQLRQGKELGPVMDDFSKRKNVRQLQGAVGILTSGSLNRKEMFEHVVLLLAGQLKFNTNLS